MKTLTHFEYKNGTVSFTIEEKDAAGNVIASNQTSVSALAGVEELIKATPTKIDDALLPYLELLAKLIPNSAPASA